MSKNPFLKTPFPDFKDLDKISKKEAREETERLSKAIEHHNYLYYVKNDPLISDNKFEELFQRLEDLEEEYPDLKSDISPTTRVGSPPVSKLKKKKHANTMLSLNSSADKEEVFDFVKSVRKKAKGKDTAFILEPKFDGLSVEIAYEKGSFSYAATRGDGDRGDDISENVKTIGSVPLKLKGNGSIPEFLSVRGEIYMSRDGFQELNKKRIEEGEDPFANARNAAAGIVRQLDPKKVAGKPLDVFFYELIRASQDDFKTHHEMLGALEEWGLKINKEHKICRKLDEIEEYFNHMSEERESLFYEIDGIVIKVDQRALRKELGTRQRSPRWAYAWKFQPRKEVTTLKDIIIQVGRTGILTPVALLEPVEVGGVTVSRATLHNQEEVKKKDVRPGDQVKVIRAGDVIPEIAERIERSGGKRSKPFKMPGKCPVCDTEVEREGAYVICPAGLSCKAQLKGSLSHYASRAALDINSLGEKVVGRLVDYEMISKIPDLYRLEKDDLKKLEGFAGKSAEKLFKAIQDSRSPDLHKFLYALGIRHVGSHVARVLAREFKTLAAIQKAGFEELKKINEIGPEIAESIVHFFRNKKNQENLEELKNLGMEVQEEHLGESNKLEGKTFVFTGELENFTRDEAKDQIESLGGRATSSVSDQTDYLVVGEGPGSKRDEAKKRDVEIIGEKRFMKMLGKVK